MATNKQDKYLYMEFGLDNGKTATIRLKDPKEDLAGNDVKPIMETIVEQEALLVGTALATSVSDAYIKTTDTVDIDLESKS